MWECGAVDDMVVKYIYSVWWCDTGGCGGVACWRVWWHGALEGVVVWCARMGWYGTLIGCDGVVHLNMMVWCT